LRSRGKLYVVGIGPGDPELLTVKAVNAIRASEYVLGHRSYVERIKELLDGKKVVTSGMGSEVERVRLAVELASRSTVSLVSGGDPNIYGMAPLVEEYVLRTGARIEYEVVPGVTALSAAAPLLGAPISGDHAAVSLSDLLVPWEKIERRLRNALRGDFVVVIYNPSSRRRKDNLVRAMDIILEERGDVFVGVVRNATRSGEEFWITTPSEIIKNPYRIDMSTILFVSNSESVEGVVAGKKRLLTPRGYRVGDGLDGS